MNIKLFPHSTFRAVYVASSWLHTMLLVNFGANALIYLMRGATLSNFYRRLLNPETRNSEIVRANTPNTEMLELRERNCRKVTRRRQTIRAFPTKFNATLELQATLEL